MSLFCKFLRHKIVNICEILILTLINCLRKLSFSLALVIIIESCQNKS